MQVMSSAVFFLIASAVAGANGYGTLPLSFEANQGQTDGCVQFLSRGPDRILFLTSSEAVLRMKHEAIRRSSERAFPPMAACGLREFYPGIDLVYYGRDGQLECDWMVKPGADPSKIRLKFEGVQSMRVDANGDLVLKTASGEIRAFELVLMDLQMPVMDGLEATAAIRQIGARQRASAVVARAT